MFRLNAIIMEMTNKPESSEIQSWLTNTTKISVINMIYVKANYFNNKK